MGVVPAPECERAHSLVSLSLDGELTEVEQAALRAHVGRCRACAGFARDVDALTRELRTAPLARPAAAVSPRRRRAAGMHSHRVLAAAAVACAAGLGSLAGSLDSRPSPGFLSASTGTLTGGSVAVAMTGEQRLPAGWIVGRSVPL